MSEARSQGQPPYGRDPVGGTTEADAISLVERLEALAEGERRDEYGLLLLLEELEDLIEEMEESGTAFSSELKARVRAIHERLDSEA